MPTKTKAPALNPIEQCQAAIAELQSALKRFDAEDVAAAAGLDLQPAPAETLFGQISQSVDRARAENSAAEAAQLRAELRAQTEQLLLQKKAELAGLEADRDLEKLREVAAIEEQNLMELCQQYNTAAAQLYALGQLIKSAPREHVVRLARIEKDSAIIMGHCPKLSIRGPVRKLQFAEN